MLTHPTHERLIALGLTGMAKALEEQRRQSDLAALDFEERLALMVDRETIERENKRLVARLKFARLRQSAVVEDINMKAPRSLDKALFQKLVAGDWIERPTIADAILDRLIHNAHRLILKGDSMRKLAAKQSGLDANQTA